MAARGRVNADLVRAAGFGERRQPCRRQFFTPSAKTPHHREIGARGVAAPVNAHPPLAARGKKTQQRFFHAPQTRRPTTRDDGVVTLAHLSGAELGVQIQQGLAVLGHGQAAGGVAVEPVREFVPLFPPCAPQRLYDAERHAAAAMHGQAGRLVHHQQVLVLVEDGVAQSGGHGVQRACGDGRRVRSLAGPVWWNPHRVVAPQAVVRPHPRTVHPHFAAAQHAVDAAARHPA